MTIVVSKGLPQYILNADTGAYELGTTRNIFTSRIQIAAILKGMNETVLCQDCRNCTVHGCRIGIGRRSHLRDVQTTRCR